jgi:hypothetical protein
MKVEIVNNVAQFIFWELCCEFSEQCVRDL